MAPTRSRRAARPARRKRGPGRPPTKETSADADSLAVRERLLDAAAAIAVERGLDAAGIRAIAERAGVSSGMIAYYFGDRRGLHEAMFERATQRVIAQLDAELAQPGEDGDPLDTLLRIHATALAADPWIAPFIAREVLAASGPIRKRVVDLARTGPLAAMQRAIAEAIERGDLRADLDPVMCMLSIASATAFPYIAEPVLGAMLGYRLDDEFRDRLIAHNQALIARGLRAPAPPAKEELA